METIRNYYPSDHQPDDHQPDEHQSDEHSLVGLLAGAGIGAVVIYRGNAGACPQCVVVEMKPAA